MALAHRRSSAVSQDPSLSCSDGRRTVLPAGSALGTAALLFGATCVAVPASAQTLDLTPEQPKATVGDIVTLNATVRLREGQQLIDLTPRTMLQAPEGVRIVSTDSLRPVSAYEFRGNVRVAFYRVGRQPVPTLSLLLRSAPGGPPDTLVNSPLAIEIVPTLPAGNPPLKDIRALVPLGGPIWVQLTGLLGLMAAAVFWLYRRHRRARPVHRRAAEPPLPSGPFAAAIRRLDALEAEMIPSGNGVVHCYARVAQILRQSLQDAGAIPHQGLTTPELDRLLPTVLATAAPGACERILTESDLVKFARLRPDRETALRQIAGARALLNQWHETTRIAAGGPANEDQSPRRPA